MQEGLPEPKSFGKLVYDFNMIIGKTDFSKQFENIVNRHKKTRL